jgi:hypothetical protein
MTAAHFAAALAIKARVPRAPTWALIVGAFIPDFVWILLAAIGIEPTRREVFFDDWSHSLLSVVVYATLYALPFRKQGREVTTAMIVAVLSHFLLDMPVHPKALALYPYSPWHIGLGHSAVSPMNYWYVQFATTLMLLALYLAAARKASALSSRILASAILVLGWHIVLLPS